MPGRKNSPRRKVAAGCGLLLLLAACWCGLLARGAALVMNRLNQIQADVQAAGVGGIDLGMLQTHVADLQAELKSLREIGSPLLAAALPLGRLPGIGNDIAAAPVLADAALDIVEAGQITLEVVSPVWPPRPVEGRSSMAVVAESLVQLPPQLAPARRAIERAEDRMDTIDIGGLSPALAHQAQRLLSVLSLAQSGFAALDLAPGLLGFDRPRTYIVLMQNDDELRPTGGFITAVARLTLDRGEIVELDSQDSYQVDDFQNKPYEWPPQPLAEYMGSELWLFRDANWSPDYPTSAQKAAELYTYGQDVPVDGVVAVNQQAVRAVVDALGPIEVTPGEPPVDGSNLIAYMRQAWEPPPGETNFGEWVTSRKEFVGKLMSAIVDRVQSSPDAVDWLAVGRAAFDALNTRDILIWIDNENAQRILARHGWDGAIRDTAGDYVMVVDSNIGFNKVNPVIESSMAYTVTLNPDGLADAELAITYRHMGAPAEGCVHHQEYTLEVTYASLTQACYWNYFRLLVPAGSSLQTLTSFPVRADYLVTGRAYDGRAIVANEHGTTEFATLIVLERGQSVVLTATYRLPAVWDMVNSRYALTVQKQPGARIRPVSVTIVWPEGYQLSQAGEPPVASDARFATFAFELARDRTLSIGLTRN